MTDSLKHTPLHRFHVDHGASMIEYAGWEMPIRYSSVQGEHLKTRSGGGVFDVSHMGRFKVRGLHARRLLDRLTSRRIGAMQPGMCRYALVCNERGGVKDDVIVYRLDDDEFMVVVNAANREKLWTHFNETKAAGELRAELKDDTEATAMVAIQGPKVMGMISAFSKEIPSLKRYRFTQKNLMVVKLLVSRTGYTGEDGVEVILPANSVGMVMKLMMSTADPKDPDAPIGPAGLGARDSLRLEAGMPLYGHELGEDINALCCGVDFAINLDKGEQDNEDMFIGQEALLKTRDEGGPAQKIIGLQLEGKRTPRQGMSVLKDGVEIGKVTSGCLSPTLEKPIAMALVETGHAAEDGSLQIELGKSHAEATVVPLPFYKAPKPEPAASAS
ncbi:MAG: glycine cleavage system aminomethyltransferase GcvT [Planctomycetota bacterium]